MRGLTPSGNPSAASPTGTDASEVTHWNQVATSTLGALPGPKRRRPTGVLDQHGHGAGSRVRLAQRDRAEAAPHLPADRRTGARASIDAAVATAAHDVISELVSTAPQRAPFPDRAGSLSMLSTEYRASLGAVPGGSFKRQGIAVGHAAAAAMLGARQGDGRFGPSAWVPNSAPGQWQPLLSAAGAPLLDPTRWAGDVRPFLIQSSSQFRSVPPPALESAQWATKFNEVKSLGRSDSATRSATQTYVAKWWQSAPWASCRAHRRRVTQPLCAVAEDLRRRPMVISGGRSSALEVSTLGAVPRPGCLEPVPAGGGHAEDATPGRVHTRTA